MITVRDLIILYYQQNPQTEEKAIDIANRFNYRPDLSHEKRAKSVRDLKRVAMGTRRGKQVLQEKSKTTFKESSFKENLDKGTLEVSSVFSVEPRSPQEIIELHKVDESIWKLSQYWSKEKSNGWQVSAMFVQKKTDEITHEELLEDLSSILVTDNIVPYVSVRKDSNKKALFVYLSDKHIGAMTKADAMYDNVYNRAVFRQRLSQVYNKILESVEMFGAFEDIYICDLGDSMDGWNGYTTRGGHKLPQNMDNREAFDTYVFEHKIFFDNLLRSEFANNYHAIMQTNDNHCFTDEVEVLTNEGWKHYVDVLEEDTIATLNTETGGVEYQSPLKRIYNPITEPTEIHEYHGRSFSIEVTAKHRMYCKKISTMCTKPKEFEYQYSEDLKKGRVYFQTSVQNNNPEFSEISDEFIQLAAWIATDGSIPYNTYIIHQSKPEGIKKIEKLITQLGVDVNAVKRLKKSKPAKEIKGKAVKVNHQMYSYVFSKTTVTKEIIDTFKKYIPSKNIPNWVEKLSKRQFDLYLQSIIDGDGNIKPGVTTSATIYGKYDFLSSFQKLCILNGHRTVLTTNVRGDHTLSVTFDKSEYDFGIKNKKVVYRQPEYTWCFTLPNSNMIVRHNGKVSVQGNSSSFGYVANQALSLYLKTAYPDIQIRLMTKFLEHINYGLHTIILTHGKDSEDLKHGLPLQLTPKAENFLEKYISYHKIDTELPIHIIKGDLHSESQQVAYHFRYRNVLSMYGASKWIMNNFGPSHAGVSFDVYNKNSKAVYSFYHLFN